MTQYIYLLQEREFIKTKEYVYKVGMTKKENHKRFNKYPKSSVLLFQMICDNCNKMEKLVLKKFKETFKPRKDIGNEYFEGDYKDMIDIIYLTIKNNNSVEDDIVEDVVIEDVVVEDVVVEDENHDIEEDWKLKHIRDIKSKKYQENAFKIVCDKINNIFPDCQQDLSFGGTKKFIKISLTDDEYFVSYINPQLKSLTYTEDGDAYIGKDYYENFTEEELIYNKDNKDYNIICVDSIKFAWNEEKNYFNLLVKEQIIIPNKIYDLLSKGFIKKLSTNKMKINIDNYEDFISTHNILIDDNIYNKIYRILCYNLVINEKIYASIDTDVVEKVKKIKDFDNIHIDIGMMLDNRNITNGKLITLHKINKKYYDYKTFLRKYIPYVIRWDINNNYYIVNRDYEYIGLKSKSIKYETGGEAYLFNDGNKPWDNRNDYIRFCNEYKKIIKDNSLKECLNTHNSTATILTLLD
jgi:hypothetical protein